MIKTKCGSCGKAYQLPDAAAGKKAKCKACGKMMAIPAAADDPLGLGGATDDKAKGDLSSLYGGNDDGSASPPPANQPVGFNPAVSFANTPRKSAGPPMKLILIGGGAVAGLLLIVVLAVVLMGGDPDDTNNDDASGGGLALGGGTAIPASGLPTLPGITDTAPGTNTQPPQSIDAHTLAFEKVFNLSTQQFDLQIPPTKDTELVNWTADRPKGFTINDRYSFKDHGIVIGLPQNWQTFAGMNVDSNTTEGYLASENGANRVVIYSTLASKTDTDWPFILVRKPDATGSSNSGTMRKLDGYLVRRENVDVSYGTLMGGYRFARIASRDPVTFADKPAKQVEYVGYVGDVLMHFTLKDAEADDIGIDTLEAVVRSARLMTEQQLEAFTTDQSADAGHTNSRWAGWLADPEVRIVHSQSTPPVDVSKLANANTGSEGTGNPTGEEGTPDAVLAGLTAPIGKDYALKVPDRFEIISNTRTAIRTQPLDDGTWLAMEVHKLIGLDRRAASPINPAKNTVFLRGRGVPIPAGVEVSELQTQGGMTIHRLLYPEPSDDRPRQVAYVIKEGMYLITVRGRFPADKRERLELLDDAARSVEKVPAKPWPETD